MNNNNYNNNFPTRSNQNGFPVSQIATSNMQQMTQSNNYRPNQYPIQQQQQQSFPVRQQQASPYQQAYPQQQSFQMKQQHNFPTQQYQQVSPLQQRPQQNSPHQQAFPYQQGNPYQQNFSFPQGNPYQQGPPYQQDFPWMNSGYLSYGDDEPLKLKDLMEVESETPLAKENVSLTKEEVENAMKLSLRLKKKILQSSSFTEQAMPMLVSLSVDNIKTENRTPLDLVCVIDRSGSMQGEKIALVRNTFQYLLQYLSDSDRLSVVIFDHGASRLFPLICTTEENKVKILQHVSTIHAGGSTSINLGMTHAFEILKQRREKNSLSSIFLLSDGLDGGAQYRVSQELERAGEVLKDTTIHTFGFGNDHDPQLMTDIAALRGGNFYFIQKLDTVDEAFVDCLGGLLSCVGQNVIIKIKPEQSQVLNGVKLTQAFGEASMWNKDGEIYVTKIASLISGKQRDFVVEVKIPVNNKELQDHEKNIVIASAEADITGLDGQHIIKKAELTITLLNEVEEVKDEEEDDREVMKNFYRLKGASLLTEARTLADQRKNDEAKKKLENFKEELSNSFLKEEQFIKNLIKDIDQAVINVTPHVYAQVGKQFLMENARAQYHQSSNLQSANGYQNACQASLLSDVRKKKGYH